MNNHPINRIIKKNKKGKNTLDDNETKIIYSYKQNSIVSKTAFWGGDYDFYIVKYDIPARKLGLLCIWDSFDLERKMTIEIDYEVEIKQGYEENVVLALINSKGDTIGESLDNTIKNISQDFFKKYDRSNISIFENYRFANEGQLSIEYKHERYIEETIGETIGLLIKVKSRVQGSENTNVKEVITNVGPLEINLKDSKEKILIKYEAKLEIFDVIKVVGDINDLRQIANNLIDDYFTKSVSFHDVHYYLDNKINDAIIEILNKEFSIYGRKLIHFSLFLDSIDPFRAESKEIYKNDIACKLENNAMIYVSIILSLTVENSKKIKDAKIENLEDWIEENINPIIQKTILFKTYDEIVLETAHEKDYKENYRQDIYNKIESFLTFHGYRVEQKLISPNLPELEWLEQLSIKSTKFYNTKNKDADIQIEFTVDGQVSNLHKVKSYIKPNFDFIKKIKIAIEKVIEKYFRPIPLEEAYGEFYNSIVQDLTLEIENILIIQFSFVNISIDIRPGKQDVIDSRLKKIQLKQGDFIVKILPKEMTAQDEYIIFKGTFYVTGIYNLDIFVRQNHSAEKTMEVIQKELNLFLEEMLPYYDRNTLLSNDFRVHEKLRTKIEDNFKKKIGGYLGLEVILANIITKREITDIARLNLGKANIYKEIENIIDTQMEKEKRLKEKLKYLYRKKNLLKDQLKEGIIGDKKELKKINKKIKKKEGKLDDLNKKNKPTLSITTSIDERKDK